MPVVVAHFRRRPPPLGRSEFVGGTGDIRIVRFGAEQHLEFAVANVDGEVVT